MTRSFTLASGVALAAFSLGCPDDRLVNRPPSWEHLDSYDQAGARLIDVLWVIDNSGSMAEEQDELANSFYQFISYFARGRVDYRIGVTTTDVFNDKGELLGSPAIITPPPRTPDPVSAFQRNVRVGTGGKGLEQGLAAAKLALDKQAKIASDLLAQRDACVAKCEGDNAQLCKDDCTRRYAPDFMRPDAYLYVVAVSDEEDHSFGEVWYYGRYVEQVKGFGNEGTTAFAAIVGEAPKPACVGAEVGARYLELVGLSGGVAGSICDQDFSNNLKALANNAAGLRRRFALTCQAPACRIDPSTIEVTVYYRCDAIEEDIGTCDERQASCEGVSADELGIHCTSPQGKIDGWEWEPGTHSIYFNGKSIPGIRGRVDIHYFEIDRASE